MKAHIESAFEAIEEINKDLQLLRQSIHKTVSLFQTSPYYALRTLESIVVNTEEYIKEKRTIEEEYRRFKGYLENSLAMKQKPTIRYFTSAYLILGSYHQPLSLVQLSQFDSKTYAVEIRNTLPKEATKSLTAKNLAASCIIELNHGRLASTDCSSGLFRYGTLQLN